MFKMLIVDDESWIRERLRYTIDWEELNVQVIGEACDGEEALGLFQSLCPDIVLTDIRMPCIDGLEFVSRIRESGSHAKVIIISGYDDFDYAQKAIKLGAYDYILKPVEDDDLISVVKRCVQELNADKDRDLMFKKAREQVKRSLPVLKEKFFINLMNGFFSNKEEIEKELEYLGIEYKGLNHICFIVQVDEYENVNTDKYWDKHLLQFAVCNIINDFIRKLGRGETFFLHTGEVVCVISSEKADKDLGRQVMSVCNGIRKITKRILGYTVTIGIGGVYDNVFDISASYTEAKQALHYKEFLGSNKIYDLKIMDMEYRPGYRLTYNMDTLLNNIKTGNKKSAIEGMRELIDEVCSTNSGISPIDLKLLYVDIASSMFRIVLQGSNSIEDFSELSISFFNRLNKLQTPEQTYEWLVEIIEKVCDQLERSKDNSRRKIIEKALDYIEKNYKDHITLNDIADNLYLNASYFCKIFKEEMGESFTKYLMKLRVEKAIEIMKDPTLKIYEVSSMVGYEDVQYFTKVFKSIKGVTPTQYREKIAE